MKALFCSLISLLFLLCVRTEEQQDICLAYTNCTLCLYNNQPCGWCGTLGKCLKGDVNGPTGITCPPKNSTKGKISSQTNAWEFTTSYVISSSTDPLSKLTPSHYEIFLRPGIPLSLNFTLQVPVIPPIDFFFLLDASISMKPYITLIRQLMPDIAGNLTQKVTEERQAAGENSNITILFGMGSYIEKPCSPFSVYPEAYVLKVHSGLTTNNTVVQLALDTLLDRLAINYEHPENPLDAYLVAAFDLGEELNYTKKIGWRKGSFKIILSCSDASIHVAGDGAHLGIFKPNNLDGIPDGMNTAPGSEEDYPDPQGFKKALISNNINPIFGAIKTSGVLQFYQDFVEKTLGGFGSWVPITADSESVVEAILNGTFTVLSKAIIAIQEDPLVRISAILPNDGTWPTKVNASDDLVFTLVMEASLTDSSAFGVMGSSIVRYVGFGDTVTVISQAAIQCLGCSLDDPSYQVDLCGVCGGNNTECIGCDGVLQPDPSKRLYYDICGVCGGNNESCVDCKGVPMLPGYNWTTYDLCGVCGGSNLTCVGCDGIPNSGLTYNACNPPVCGGPPCQDYTAVIALASIAVVGIVAAIVALILLCGAGAAMASADADLMDQETSLHDNPLYEEAKRKFDNPMWDGDEF